jgi:hypothetical protein
MADSRHYPIRGASIETGITDEVRDLIKNVKHAENIETWCLSYQKLQIFVIENICLTKSHDLLML